MGLQVSSPLHQIDAVFYGNFSCSLLHSFGKIAEKLHFTVQQLETFSLQAIHEALLELQLADPVALYVLDILYYIW